MTREEIQEWLTEWLADRLCVAPEDIERDRTLASLGVEQEDLEEMQAEVAEYFEEEIEEGVVRLRATVATLTRYLCELTGTDEDDELGSGNARDPEMDEMLRDMGVQ